jgi:hypothetical protein
MHGLFLYISGMKYFLYIFYRYYGGSSYESMPYISALTLFVLSLSFYVLSLYMLIFPETEIQDKDTFLVWTLSIFAIACFLVWFFIREKDLRNPEFDERYRKSHGFLLMLYLACGLTLFFVSVLYSKGHSESSYEVDEVIFEELPTIDQSELREKEPQPNTAQ